MLEQYPIPPVLGLPAIIELSDPGAGNEFDLASSAIGDEFRYRVLAVRCTFTTSATAGSRYPGLKIYAVSNSNVLLWLAPDVISESDSKTLNWMADGVPRSYSSHVNDELFYRLPFMEFNRNIRLGSETVGIDGSDAFTDVRITITKWAER
jgi:hypothetical protein